MSSRDCDLCYPGECTPSSHAAAEAAEFDAETCKICGATPGSACDLVEHRAAAARAAAFGGKGIKLHDGCAHPAACECECIGCTAAWREVGSPLVENPPRPHRDRESSDGAVLDAQHDQAGGALDAPAEQETCATCGDSRESVRHWEHTAELSLPGRDGLIAAEHAANPSAELGARRGGQYVD